MAEKLIEVSHGGTNKKLAEAQLRPLNKMRESVLREYRYDPEKIWAKSEDYGFSLNRARESMRRTYNREAISDAAFAALTRYGVQKTLTDVYNLVPTVYKEIAQMVTSRTREEWYNPLQRTDIPVEVKLGEDLPAGRLRGLQVIIVNKKFGRILEIEDELFEDDQTGQIKMRCSEMGEAMVYAEEVQSMISLFNSNGYSGAQVLNITYNGSSVTTGPMTQTRLEAAWTQATIVKDLLGNFMAVRPDSLVCTTIDELTAEKLLQSMFQPSQPDGVAGNVGYFGTVNVLKGKFKIQATPFVLAAGVRSVLGSGGYPWALIQARKSLVFQNRTPIEVIQEVPNSGPGFTRDEIRYKVKRRFGTGVIDPRFNIFGN